MSLELANRPLPAALGTGIGVSVAAYVTTLPVVAYHFGWSAPVSLLSNVAALPLTGIGIFNFFGGSIGC